MLHLIASLVPRPPPFYVLRFTFSIIHGSGTQTEEQKRGRPGNEAILLQLHRIILYTYTIKAVYTGTQCIRARCLTLSLSLFTSVILATFTWPTLWYFETSRILSLAYLVMVLEYTKQPEILAVFKFGSLDPNQLYKKIGSL